MPQVRHNFKLSDPSIINIRLKKTWQFDGVLEKSNGSNLCPPNGVFFFFFFSY